MAAGRWVDRAAGVRVGFRLSSMTQALSDSSLDAVLALQLTIAWAGEGRSRPKRLGWWETDLVDPEGGGDLFARLTPQTAKWAALEAVREAARRVEARARARMADPDKMRAVFFLGFEVDEQLNDRLASLKRARRPPGDALRLPVPLGATFEKEKVIEALRAHGEAPFAIVPGGRQLKGEMPAEPIDAVRRLAAALVPLADQLGNLPADDPAVAHLRADLKREVGIPEELTSRLLTGLAGVDYLGSLLKVDAAVETALRSAEVEFERSQGQGDLFGGFRAQQVKLSLGEAKATILDRLERFLGKHSTSEDLGLRLDGEQLAAGVRFVRMAKEGAYDVVVGNPPYQRTGKMADARYVVTTYPRGKADLYAAFLERGLALVRPGGLSAMLTMRAWMFLGPDLREHLLKTYDLRLVGDVDRGAFEDIPDEKVAVSMSIFRRGTPANESVAIQPTLPTDTSRDSGRTRRKRAALLAQVGRFEFSTTAFEAIEGAPILYWWSQSLLTRYAGAEKLGARSKGRAAQSTGNNERFIRRVWEVGRVDYTRTDVPPQDSPHIERWSAVVNGSDGLAWLEPLREVANWRSKGLEIKQLKSTQTHREAFTLASEGFFFGVGIAFSMIGNSFGARAHRYRSVLGDKGSSLYPSDIAGTLCAMNRREARNALESLNPTVSFQVGDVNRLPIFPVKSADEIFATIDRAFTEHEAAREASIEFQRPGPSPWRYAQDWAQRAVDRHAGEALPPYEPIYEPPQPADFVSYAFGLAIGRFPAEMEPLLHGILFLSAASDRDLLDHPACAPLLAAWEEHGPAVGNGDDLRTYLRKSFFDHHKKLYENRPIYFPLSSAKKNFVAFVAIHRWQDTALTDLLADHLLPAKRGLDGEIDDLRTARISGTNRARAEKRFAEVQILLKELADFITAVTAIAESGPPPPDDKTPKREVDARFRMDLDDGVMANSAALWPLLDPQWKDPRKWWKDLAAAQGKKDYDWSHLAARYFPARVRTKCHDDPSLAVAHACFWELHPAKAYTWELRLQDEIRPDFTIDEPGSDAARVKFLAGHVREAAEIRASKTKRRERKAAKAEEPSEDGPLFERDGEEEPAE
jgi:hypothetical protein